MLLLAMPLFSTAEHRLTDLRHLVRRAATDQDASSLAVLLVDREAEERLGKGFGSAWRGEFVQVVEQLNEAGAAVIVFDFVFVSDVPEYDEPLLAALQSGAPVFSGITHDSVPLAHLADGFAAIGSLDITRAADVPRSVISAGGRPPISSLAAQRFSGANETPPARMYIDYGHSIDAIPSFSITDLLFADEQRLADDARTPLSVLTDRIVLIGTDLAGVDEHRMPGYGANRQPGVYAHAVATLTALGGSPPQRLPKWASLLLAVGVAIVAGLAAGMRRRVNRRLASALVFAAALLVPLLLFVSPGIELLYLPMLAAAVFPAVTGAVLRRIRVSRQYATSLGFDPELIERKTSSARNSGEPIERNACVVCTDVREFTQFVTDNDPGQVHQVMDEYLRTMEQVIDAEGGYVNKYVGDEIVAVFGFPQDERDAVTRGVRAALSMLDEVELLKAKWHLADLPALEAIGIGVDYGPLRFSHFGGKKRVQFDVLGNAVNGASRLQAISKDHSCALVLPDSIAEHQSLIPIAAEEKDGRALTFLGEVMVRGQGRRRVYGLPFARAEDQSPSS